jgi:hypothetical protein
MKLKYTISLLLTVVSASATVSINFNADSLRTSTGNLEGTSTLAFLVADAGVAGFGAIEAGSINQYDVIGSGDVVVARFDFSNFGTPGVISVGLAGIDLNGFTGGSQLAIVWMTGLTTANTSTAASQSYGILSDVSWITPNDGGTSSTYQLISTTNNDFFTDTAETLNVSDFASRASFNVVPEPATYAAIAGMLAIGAVMVRRRRS